MYGKEREIGKKMTNISCKNKQQKLKCLRDSILEHRNLQN